MYTNFIKININNRLKGVKGNMNGICDQNNKYLGLTNVRN